ncbi:Nuclear envelope morphology protein 1 [Mortierella alpina]|nr:Nuclear envelope morphology protein 1 [Mortierella alpina]
MISPSNLPSPAGYSFGSYGPMNTQIQDDQPGPDPQAPHLDPSLASSSSVKAAHLRQSSGSSGCKARTSTGNSNTGSVNSASLASLSTASAGSSSLPLGTAAMASSTLSLGSGTNTTPSTTFQRSAPAASLSVALCRSVVLKYLYLTYLFLLQILLAPSVAVQTFILRRRKPINNHDSNSSSSSNINGISSNSSKGRTGGQESEAMDLTEGVGAVGQKFLQQYTLDNHLGHYSISGNSGSSSAANHQQGTYNNNNNNNNNSSSSNNNNNNNSNNNNGNSMLRRSSRFKSRSDLEEIAQSSTPTLANASTEDTLAPSRHSLSGMTRSASSPSPSSSSSSSSVAVAPSRPSFTSAVAHGYGTDSMAEDASGDNSATGRGNKSVRLRQRMGRPMSGLGVPGGGHGHGPGMGKKKTLVLDLDETLIHSTSRGSRSQGYMVEVLVDRHACLYYVYKRPHVDYFLKKVSEWYKLVIFTASMAEYADPVIDWLDQNRTLFDRRYFRQACFFSNGSYLKDLTVIDPDLSSVCLLDNSPLSYSLNKENGIPIDSWIDNPNDEALLDLLPFLDALRFTEDVRSVLSLRTV